MDNSTSLAEKVRTTNVVVSVALGCTLDLYGLYVELGADHCKFQPKKFHGLIYRLPHCTMNIYSNGSILCTGAKSMKIAKQNLMQTVTQLRNLGFNVSKRLVFKNGNRVGTFSLCDNDKKYLTRVYSNKEAFQNICATNLAIYEPSRFCALTWYSKNGVTIIAFRTGRCIITGKSSKRDHTLAIDEFIGEKMYFNNRGTQYFHHNSD